MSTAAPAVGPELTPDQIASFHEQGYLILPAVFSPDEIARMRREADFIVELVINATLAMNHRIGRLDLCELEDGTHMVRKIQPINDLSLYLAQVSADERLVTPMRQLMEDEPVLMEEKLNYKQPLHERIEGLEGRRGTERFPVHHDWAYYRAQGYPTSIISSAISMDDCNPDSGPLRVWPGSHKNNLEHESMEIGLQVLKDQIDHEGGQDILAPAGSVMLFHSLLVHNSRPNTSGKPRRLMIYSHYPKAADMGIDVRNGPGRLATSPWLWQYMRMKLAGEWTDRFHAPKTD